MKKLKTIPKLKKELDSIFSRFIRLRNADDDGYVNCVTCLKVDHWRSMDCGHFQSRRHLSTRWDEDNTAPQCKRCNIFNQGEQFKFAKAIDDKFGKGKAEELEIKSKQLKKFDRFELERMHLEYKQEVEYHLDRIGEK